MKQVVIACHQPNFLPWLGFFAKLQRADIFVLLDDVQFTQGANKHNWTTRVRIMGPNGPLWLTMPVRRGGLGKQRITDLATDVPSKWLPSMLRTLEQSYSKSPFSKVILPSILDVLGSGNGSVCETNIGCIKRICEVLGLNRIILRSSSLSTNEASTARLIDLVKGVGGNTYLAGDGAQGYQEVELFAHAQIGLIKLDFAQIPYPQRHTSAFVPGLSILDALCNVGVERTKELLEARKQA